VGGAVLISRCGGSYLLHTLQIATNYPVGAWVDVPGAVDLPSTGGTVTVSNVASLAQSCFYRVMQVS